MEVYVGNKCAAISPTPHGVGGLKFTRRMCQWQTGSPTPHGVGGLKSLYKLQAGKQSYSPTPHGVGGLK